LPQSILALNLFFHLIATVLWLGGLATLAVLVFPATARVLRENAELYALLSRLRRRFFPISNISLAVLVVTGMFQMSANPNYDGMLQFANEWSRAMLFKHIAVVGMAIAGLVLQYSVAPALERATLLVLRGKAGEADHAELVRLRRREARLTWALLALGAAVLAFTAWATSL
jgi:uncharacterized membrane protein